MRPPPLHSAHRRIGKPSHRAHQEIRRRLEVGIEQAVKLARGQRGPMRQRPRLIPGPLRTPHHLHRHATRPPIGRPLVDDGHGLVLRVIQQLQFEAVARPLQCRARVDHQRGHVLLVVQGHLHRHVRPVARIGGQWRRRAAPRTPYIVPQQVRLPRPVEDESGRPNEMQDKSSHRPRRTGEQGREQ